MSAKIVVDNRVRLDLRGLPEAVLAKLRAEFEHTNPEFAKKANLGLPTWNVPRVIRTWRFAADEASFPRGGFSRVRRILREAGVDFVVRDARQYGVAAGFPPHRLDLYPYQRDLVDRAIEREQCLVRAPTGSGKTSALLAIASELCVPTLVVVHSQALLDQWKKRAVAELGIPANEIGIVQGKRLDLRPLTLTIQKTMATVAARSREVRDFFGCVLADEVHLFAAKTFFECIDPFPARYRIGVSADHRRKDRKEFLVHDLFGPVAAEVTREELVRSGHVLDVEIRVVPTDFAAPWYGVPESEKDERKLDFVRLVKEMAADSDRNWAAVRIVREAVAEGEQVLVMAHEREHCMRLGQTLIAHGIPTGYLLGGPASATEMAASLAGLADGSLRVGVGTYKAIGTGIDLPRVGVAVATTPIASNQQLFGQVRGRVCRVAEGKEGARLYVLWDRLVYRRHLRNMAAWNPSVVVREKGDWVPARVYIKDSGI